jgi:uncharacterized protein (TIGR02118 family)
VLLARRPAAADDAWLRRSLATLALRFPDARVRLFAPDVATSALVGGVRALPPPASFDVAVVIERPKARWRVPGRAERALPADDPRGDALESRPTPSEPRAGGAPWLAWLSGARGYRVRGRVLQARAAPPRPAERAAGLVLVATAVRARSLSPAGFDRHWEAVHAPLARRHHAGLEGYEQLVVEAALTPSASPLDGIALLHFPSEAAFRDRFYDGPAGRAAIAADTARFLDLPRCEAALLGEHWARV